MQGGCNKMLETKTIDTVFFDVGGVLMDTSLKTMYKKLVEKGKEFDEHRFREAMHDYRVLTGESGDLARLLERSYDDLNLNAEEIIQTLREASIYNGVWDIARDLRNNRVRVGVVSDMIYEGVQIIRKINDFNSLFDPILFSCEVKTPKSNRFIFDKARKMIGLIQDDVDKLLMVDDHEHVLDITQNVGWSTLLYDGDPAKLRESLHNYGLL